MSQGRRLTALVAVACIGVAGVLSAAQWVRDAGDTAARFLPSPVVVAQQGAVRPVEGRPLEWWGKTTRRTDRVVGDPAAVAGVLGAVLLAVAVGLATNDRRLRLSTLGSAQERGPPLLLVH